MPKNERWFDVDDETVTLLVVVPLDKAQRPDQAAADLRLHLRAEWHAAADVQVLNVGEGVNPREVKNYVLQLKPDGGGTRESGAVGGRRVVTETGANW